MIERQKRSKRRTIDFMEEPMERRMMTCRMEEQVPPLPMQEAHGDRPLQLAESRSLTNTDPEQ